MRLQDVLIRVAGATIPLIFAVAGVARAQGAVDATTPAQGLIREPHLIERAVIFADRREANGEFTNGFYPHLWNMVPGAGWLAAGPGYRHWYAQDRVFVDTSAAVSWRGYKTADARLEFPKIARSRLTVGSHFRWQDFTQVNFYGEGAETLPVGRSEYRIRSHDLVGYASFRPFESLAIGAHLGWFPPSILPRAGWFEGDDPDARDAYATNSVFTVADDPRFAHREVSATVDTRDFPRHPTRGALYRAAAASYHDTDDVFSFRRYNLEAAHFIPFADARLVLALHGSLVTSNTSPGDTVPFYLQPTLGGHNSLRAYADFRFHDRNMMLMNVEARVALMSHVDVAAFVDAGNVAPRIADLNLDRRSYGGGLRLHTNRHTFARIDIARGGEGWRLLLRLSDPLDLSRLSRRTAAAPFVP